MVLPELVGCTMVRHGPLARVILAGTNDGEPLQGRFHVALPSVFVARIVNVYVPAVGDAPDISPVLPFSVVPVGIEPLSSV